MYLANIMPPQASTTASQVDNIYYFLSAITIFFSILILVLIVLFSVKYRRKSDNDKPAPIEGNHLLEAIWIGVPTILVMVIFVWGTVVYFNLMRVPKNAMEVYGVGKQWMWKFQHPEGKREINDLHVPAGEPVKVILTSEDVIHSFYVPDFRVKMDALPGRYTQVWFEANEPGEYHLFCAEYCGTKHSQMIGKVIVLSPEDYKAWLTKLDPDETPMITRGEELFREFRCNTCHGSVNAQLGPSLKGIAGTKRALNNGKTAVADDVYLRESILTPSKKVTKGYSSVMPTYNNQINEEQLLQIISYIKSLKE